MTKGLDKLILSPAVWLGKKLEVQPGDLSKFAPYGNGFYGYEKNSFEPIRGDPPQEETGGFVYFGNGVSKENFEGFLRMMNIRVEDKDYAAFVQESFNPIEDRYLTQMRFVSKFGLEYMFNAIDDKEYYAFKDQDLTVGEALTGFIDVEKERYGTCFWDSPKLAGKMGGDGNFAREELSFGFMIENEYNRVYRIWSRAWLVTK